MVVGDCWHHLKYIWVGAGLKHLGTYLTNLVTGIDDVHFILCASISIGKYLIAIEKELGATANYTKDHKALFLAWMRRYYPGALLLPVPRVTT